MWSLMLTSEAPVGQAAICGCQLEYENEKSWSAAHIPTVIARISELEN